jgi:guanylate kinase
MADPTITPAPTSHRHRGVLVIISSPSGAGKTTLSRRLLTEFPSLEFSVSYTTRAQRPNEVEGRDYHFVSNAEFDRMIAADEFAEWFPVHGNRYGTGRAAVERALDEGRDILFDVDWQGGAALSGQWPEDALKIFILPPDLAILASRLRTRATDAVEVIERRLRTAIDELNHYGEYEHLIVNDDLERAYDILRAIYLVRRHRDPERPGTPADLPRLRALVDHNGNGEAARHAQALISGGSTSSRS